MPTMQRVTDKTIAGAKAGVHTIEPNLILRVSKTGAKSWVFRYFKAGKVSQLGLGSYPAVTLASVRETAESMRGDVAEGSNPALRLERNKPKAKTFRTYALAYVSEHEGGWRNDKHRQQWSNTLRDYVYPHIGDKAVSEITAGDVHALLLPLWAVKTETATRLRMRIERVLNYAFTKEGIDKSNPAAWKGKLEHLLPNPRKTAETAGKRKSHAAPPWREVPAIMASLRKKPEVVSALALRFSILTAARSMEVRGLMWAEIDLEKNVWRLPAARSKNGKIHKVPLNAEAVQILEAMLARKLENSDRVFPGERGGLLSDVAINKQLKAAYPGVTAHGIARSSFRDWAAENHFPDKVTEAALNHTNPNATEAAYLRTKFFDARVKLMEAWASFCAGISANNVGQFNKEAAN